MPRIFWRFKNEFLFFSQLFLLLGFLILTTMATLGWDPNKVNYTKLGIMTFYSLYSKFIASNYTYSTEISPKVIDGKETNEIVKLENYIIGVHHEVINDNRTVRFCKALMYRNYIYRIRNEILHLDIKSQRHTKQRLKNAPKTKLLHEMLKLLNDKKYDEFEMLISDSNTTALINIKKLSRFAMKRSNVKMTTLFNTKSRNIDDDLDGGVNALTFNRLNYTFKTQALIIILLPVFQIILTGLVTEGYLNSMQLWLDLFGSMASIGIALYNGFTAGFDAARNGYKPVVQERINTIQEVLNIEKELVKPEV